MKSGLRRLWLWGAVFGCSCAIAHGAPDPAASDRAVSATKELARTAAALERRWRRFTKIQQQFLMGVTYSDRGRAAQALPHLQAIRGAYPVLDDYVLYYSGRAALANHQPAQATEAFDTLLASHARSRFRWDAQLGLADAAAARGAWADAHAQLAALRAANPSRWRQRLLQERQAEMLLRQGDHAAAADRYYDLYTSAQYPDEATRARAGLQRASTQGGRDRLDALSTDARRTLAQRLLDRGLAQEAARLLEPLAHDAGLLPLRARAYFAARQYVKAADLYAQLWARHGGGDLSLLQQYATATARAQRDGQAIALQQRIIDRHVGTATARLAQWKQASLMLDAGHYAQAAAGYRTWLAAHGNGGALSPAGEQTLQAWWAVAWCEYRQRHWAQALAALDALAARLGSRDRLWRAQVAYWRARTLERSGAGKPAREAYREIAMAHGGTYYGALASARLRGTGHWKRLFVVPKRWASHATPSVGDWSPKAAELHRLGLWEHAVEESDAQAEPARFGEQHRYAVAQYGRQWGIDPQLVLQVMRQESGFSTTVVSRAGAVGLLQLMPGTAQSLARQLAWDDFHAGMLFRPLPNIRLGMWYLRTLFDHYQGALPHVLASYNAGEGAVDRWRRRRADHDWDEFIETIPFTETRNYVKRILMMYW